MFCNNCGTQYDVTPLAEGKSKFCRSCGNLLYRNISNSIVFNDASEQSKQQVENEKNRQEAELAKAREIAEQQRLEKERHEQEKRDEELKTLQAQLEKERQERERLEKEKRELELREKEKIAVERARLEAEKKEREALEILLREKERKDRELQDQVRLALEKIKQEEAESSAMVSTEPEPEVTSGNGVKLFKYALILIAITVISGLIAYYFVPDKIMALLGQQTAHAETASEEIPAPKTETDSLLLSQIRNDLAGNEVLSWGPLQLKDIQSLILTDKSETEGIIHYKLLTELDDRAGTKAIAELELTYEKILLDKVTTRSITYKNTAPANAWFSFQPVPNCTIMVNTNGNTIQAKSCNNCLAISITSTKENPTRLTNTQNVFITSASQSDILVDFTYLPNSTTP